MTYVNMDKLSGVLDESDFLRVYMRIKDTLEGEEGSLNVEIVPVRT